MKEARINIISRDRAYIFKVSLEAKCDEVMEWFIEQHPQFVGQVTMMKRTKHTESNGDPHQRHYTYEVDQGKYRKYRYSKPTNWKIVIA